MKGVMEQNQWEYKPIFFGSKLVKNHGRCSVDPETRIGSICFIAETFPFWLFQTVPFLPPITLCPVFLFLEKIYVSLYPCQDTEPSFMPGLDCLFPEKINLDLTDGMVGWSGLGGWSDLVRGGWDDLVKDGMIWSRIGRMIWSGMVGWYGKGWEFSEKILSSG